MQVNPYVKYSNKRSPVIHELKCLTEFFDPTMEGLKTFELRYNDRDFRVDDVLVLREWTALSGFTGAAISFKITYVLSGGPWLSPGYVALGLDG